MKTQVLIIDDEPEAIRFVQAALSEADDFEFSSFVDGDEGLNMSRHRSPHLTVPDVMIPKKGGFEVFYEL
jgi:DNA-binding response OmpR family regulator